MNWRCRRTSGREGANHLRDRDGTRTFASRGVPSRSHSCSPAGLGKGRCLYPYVTVLGQENLGRRQPPDDVIVARDGEDYGFPGCNWSKPAACASFAKPVAFLLAHSSPTGIAAQGSTLLRLALRSRRALD